MSGFIGEYHCKLDTKGRMLIPSDVKKQLPPEDQDQFIISRGVDDYELFEVTKRKLYDHFQKT